MRKLVTILLGAATLLHAQVGIARNSHGLRVPSAYTLKQGFIYFSGYFENISDGEPLAIDGYTDVNTGERFELDNSAVASGGAFQISYGAFDFLELGFSIPFYYESKVTDSKLEGLAPGDLQGTVKASLPLNLPFHLSFEGNLYFPTGTKGRGFSPRRAWFIKDNDESYAYTTGGIALSGISLLTFDLFGLVLWNNMGGYLSTFGNGSDVLLWGSGFELFPDKLISLIAEVSGEARVNKMNHIGKFWNEPARFTPGLRLHLPRKTDIMFGADIGIDFLRGRKSGNGIEVVRTEKDRTIKYEVPSTHEISVVFALSKVLDFSWKDSDHDGVVDRMDMCPGSTFGVKVNNRGCPVDEDQDGILNIVDDCPNTPFGIDVDFFGCPFDEDLDKVPDYLDKCPKTPSGTAVDRDGCTLDSDRDGVDDNNDLCPDTSPEEQVNTSGCPIDNDHDGVINERDKCPETPAGRSVDQDGCPLDFDHDGVPDDIDQCPNSAPDELVDASGCPADQDKDGVPDTKDQGPDTPNEISVDRTGCPSDNDRDGEADYLDKCPNTPTQAPVDTIGCPKDSDGDGIADYLDKCPDTFPDVLVNNSGCPYSSKKNLNSIAKQIRYRSGSVEPLNSSYTALNDVIELMRRYEFNLEIEVSASGPNAQAVSEARAGHLYDILKIKGYDEKRVKIKAVGNAFAPGVKFFATDIKR